MAQQPEIADGDTGADESGEFDGWRTFSGWLWIAYLFALAAGAALLL
jgi:hypothetical protein